MKLERHIILRLRESGTFMYLLPGSPWRSAVHSDFISCCEMDRNLKYHSQTTGLNLWSRIFLGITTLAQPDMTRASMVHPEPDNCSAHPQTLLIYQQHPPILPISQTASCIHTFPLTLNAFLTSFHSCYIPRPHNSPRLYHPNNIW